MKSVRVSLYSFGDRVKQPSTRARLGTPYSKAPPEFQCNGRAAVCVPACDFKVLPEWSYNHNERTGEASSVQKPACAPETCRAGPLALVHPCYSNSSITAHFGWSGSLDEIVAPPRLAKPYTIHYTLRAKLVSTNLYLQEMERLCNVILVC